MELSDSAETYYGRALRVNPQSLEAGKALGMIHLTGDRRDKAMKVFDRLLAANKHSLSAYKTVGTALRDLGRYEEALEIFKQGRDRGRGHFILSLEIANIHKTNKNYGEALTEYLGYVEGRRGNYRVARSKILEMIQESGDKREELVGMLEGRLDNTSGRRYVVLDVLAATYLESGLLEKALDMALRADGEKESDGTALLTFADNVITRSGTLPRLERRRYLELGVRALAVFTENHPRMTGIDKAKYMLASIYAQFGRGEVPGLARDVPATYLDKAIELYTEISKRHAGTEYAELASLEKGDLLLHSLKQPDKALEAYKIGAVNSRHYGDVFAARIARVYLGLGNYEDADHYFKALIKSGVVDLVQAGFYYTGLMLAFQGEYATARDTLTYLAESNPSSPYTNDAIETAWILEEGLGGQTKSLAGLLRVIKAELIGDTATVVTELNKLVEGPVYDPSRPRALFKLGTTLYENGDLDGAVAALKRFMEEYPSSSMRADVQRKIANVYEFGYEKYEQALREYEVVLMLYPDYAFLDEVRKDVRRLRFIVEGEE
jgi:tetratricopeptide (TPR) repeat protein